MAETKVLLSTIWHTGSNSVRNELQDQGCNVSFQHCDHELFAKRMSLLRQDFDRYITTIRNPLHIGASWGNRYDLTDPKYEWHWYTLFAGWQRFVQDVPAEIVWVEAFTGRHDNRGEDTKGLHEALKSQDWDRYHAVVPEEWIYFAEQVFSGRKIGTHRILTPDATGFESPATLQTRESIETSGAHIPAKAGAAPVPAPKS